MFTTFFYLLKERGLDVSTTEWLTFIGIRDFVMRALRSFTIWGV